jgi:uncharacterized SAM-binding protein YcdF (DUF218 family)
MMLFKEVADVAAKPLAMVALLAIAAWLSRLAKRPRMTLTLLSLAALLTYLSSIPLVGQALLHPLESKYAPLAGDQPPESRYIVVLGSGYAPHDDIPVTAALDSDGLVRVVEAVRLAQGLQGSRLIVSGGAMPGRVPPAQGYARLARSLGIPQQTIIVSDQSLDTRDEARAVAKLLGRSPFLLVTSAYHMPRAMLVMKQAGTNPIAAPTGQRAFGPAQISWRSFLPGSNGLGDSERALHEYLGLAAIASGLY